MEGFEKHIVSDLKNVFSAKLYIFLRKSTWKYLIAALLFTFVTPGYLGGFLTRLLVIWLSLLAISLIAIYTSSVKMSKEERFDAMVKFQLDSIVISPLDPKEPRREETWDWVEKIKISKNMIRLKLAGKSNHLLTLKKRLLSVDEIDFMVMMSERIKK